MGVRENIIALRKKYDVTQEKLAEIANVAGATVSGWERGISDPRIFNLQKIADYFNMSIDDLRSEEYGLARKQTKGFIKPVPSYATAPVLGYVPAGDPSEAIEIEEQQHWVDPDIKERYPDAFFLVVAGDSMNNVLPDGSFALINPKGEPQNRDIVAIIVNGDDVTIKRIYFADNSIVLNPDSTNPRHRARFIDGADENAPATRILGTLVWHVVPIEHSYK